MNFREIPGLHQVKSKLVSAASRDQLAHALLFEGQSGCLNLPLALALATYLNCENPNETDACGTCPACLKNKKWIHPDLHFIYPEKSAKKKESDEEVHINTNTLKQWRSFISDTPWGTFTDWSVILDSQNSQPAISVEKSRQIITTLSLMAFEGQYKIMLIWLPELMKQPAANAILKILEEPPQKTIFLLVSNQRDRLLPTILSRTQIIHVPLLEDSELKNWLIETKSATKEQAGQAVQLAEGNLSRALTLIEDNDEDLEKGFIEWMRICYARDYENMVHQAEYFQQKPRSQQKAFFEYSLSMLREALVFPVGESSILRSNDRSQEFIKKFSSALSMRGIEQASTLINEADYHLERNANPKITYLDLSINLSKKIRQ